jgi:hypothetical protein
MPCSDPKRYQSVELPPVEPHVTEYRRHEVACHDCEHHTLAPYDANVIPASPFGPRLTAAIGLFTGVYHLSRRTAREMLGDLMGVTISLGGLSGVEARVADAVGPAVDEAWEQTREATVKHTDGTTWLQGGVAMSLWTVATSMVTVFTILANGRKDTLEPLYGELKGILVSDRATALNFWAMDRRQICWAHLLRKFVSFSERDGRAKAIGRTLLDYTGLVFEYWHNYKDGKLDKQQFDAWMAPVREQFEAELKRAVPRTDLGVIDAIEPLSAFGLVVNQELPTVRRAAQIAAILRQRYGKERVQAVVSRYDTRADIGREDIERVVGLPVSAVLPSDYRKVIASANVGQPLIADNHTRLANAIRELAVATAGPAPAQPAAKMPRSSGRFLLRS